MSKSISERAILPGLKDPVMISAFATPYKGGATATTALSYLLNQWGAQQVAEFEAEDCYNYSRMRPQVQRVGEQTVINWPTNIVYLVNPPEAQRSFLFLLGMEPSTRWRSFVEGIADFARRMGVQTSVVLRGVPGAVTHKQLTPLLGIYSDPSLAEEFGVDSTEMPEGALDIGALLNLTLREHGCRTVDIVALEPFYTAGLPDAKAGVALLNAIGHAFDLPIGVEDLAVAAQAQYVAIENTVSSSEQAQALVSSLERRGIGLVGETDEDGRKDGSSSPLTADDAAAAVSAFEALLKRGRESRPEQGSAPWPST